MDIIAGSGKLFLQTISTLQQCKKEKGPNGTVQAFFFDVAEKENIYAPKSRNML